MSEVKRTIRLENLGVHSGYKMFVFDPSSGGFQKGTFNYVPEGLSFVHLRGKNIIPVNEGRIVQVISYSGGKPKGRGTFRVIAGAKRERKPGPGRGFNLPRVSGEVSMNWLERHLGEELHLGGYDDERGIKGRLQVERGEFYLAGENGGRTTLAPGEVIRSTYPTLIRVYKLAPGRVNPELTWPGPDVGADESRDSACL